MEEIRTDKQLDCRGLSCPMPMLKIKKALKEMGAGEVLHMMGTDPGTKKDIENATKKGGHQFLGFRDEDGFTSYYIQKG
jgi:tRNA 2-thiouridine synthesizing protein A